MSGLLVLPCHVATTVTPMLVVAVSLAGLGSAVVAALGIAAFAQRRSGSYLLVALALSAVLARSAVAVLTIGGVMPFGPHHTAEHALDFVLVTLVLAAVYYARRVESAAGVNR
ncbi:DUF7471 family protein [Halogranum amylolyticum]|uniref:DUF7471 family protein n=1 Tax=Halogranum amylolyticum TaxID=660520 RepID=UPI000B7E117C|nr:hypothetical protein [Halogranum amylolyticum]